MVAVSCSESVGEKANAEKMHIFSSAEAEIDFNNGNYRFITYGLEAGPYYDRESVDEAFGIHYENQGCEVEDSSLIGANAYNFRMEWLLRSKLGKNWKIEYDWKCDSLEHEHYLAHKNDSNYY
jgi:hypothetical protein